MVEELDLVCRGVGGLVGTGNRGKRGIVGKTGVFQGGFRFRFEKGGIIMKKIVKKCVVALVSAACLVVMAACGSGGDDGAACTIVSEDGKYEFKVADNWTCWISEAGKGEKLVEGSFSIREENSAVTIILGDEIVEMDNGDYTYRFAYGNEELGIGESVFEAVRNQVLSDLDTVGVILKTDDIGSGEESGDEGPGEMGGFSMAPGVILWNDGTIQLNIIKVQAAAQFTYSKEEGFQVTQTEHDKEIYGLLEGEDRGDTLVLKYTEITANLPFGMSKTGSVTFNKADLEAALQLD